MRIGANSARTSTLEPWYPAEAELVIDRALGRSGRLRIVGCIEDLTLDLVRADVVAFEATRG
ncbi:MAG: hypothetical protein ACO35E_03390 [Ilumatobacteraceae bacterium]